MTAPVPIEAAGAIAAANPVLAFGHATPAASARPVNVSFSEMLLNGVSGVDRKVQDADAMAKAFALDDSVPLHQVTFALEQARLSMELMLQVRSHLVEGYQELMRMQL
jgi:flagellar hook-basal body complex protein FliE